MLLRRKIVLTILNNPLEEVDLWVYLVTKYSVQIKKPNVGFTFKWRPQGDSNPRPCA